MQIKPYVGVLLVVLLTTIPIFGHLDSAPIYIWDEARLATSALEMKQTHNILVTTVNGQPDMWSTKPPLMIWVQAFMISIVGPSELAVRLPSAVAALLTFLMLYFLFVKKAKNPLLGIISVIILLTSQGYIFIHGTRTGDYDAMLTLFTTAYALAYFSYIEENNRRNLLLTFLLLACAALTKGVQALMFLPALFIYTIFRNKIIYTLKCKEFYIGLAIFLTIVPGYYLLREHFNPGYINAVLQNEVTGRYNTVIENHVGDELYYYDFLISKQFKEWYLLIIPGLIVGIFCKNTWLKNISIFSFTLSLVYFLILSGCQTKIYWYSMPIFPFLAIVTGTFIYTIYDILNNMEGWRPLLSRNILPPVFLFLIFFKPYGTILDFSLSNDISFPGSKEKENMAYFLKDAVNEKAAIDGLVFWGPEIEQDFFWYYSIFKHKKYNVGIADFNSIDPNCKLIVYREDSRKFIDSVFNTQIIHKNENIVTYKLNGRK